jgi:hypothetical protein
MRRQIADSTYIPIRSEFVHFELKAGLRSPRVAYMIFAAGILRHFPTYKLSLFPSAAAPIVAIVAMCLNSAFASLLRVPVSIASALFLGEYFGNIYNILIAAVFGFSSLSVLGLATSRAAPRRGLTFGEILAVTAVFVSIGLWGWEMLQLYHIFPIKLHLGH